VASRRLTTLDASFLYMERPEAPLNIGAVQVFDGPLSRQELVPRLRRVVGRLPRYRQRVVGAPLGLGLPFWEDDPAFDVGSHLVETSIAAPGTERELRECAARLLEMPLSRERPLWEMHLVHGLGGGRAALVTRIHHAMVDGLSGVAFMEEFLDLSATPTSPPASEPAGPASPASAIERGLEVAWDAGRYYAGAIGSGVQAAGDLVSAPREALDHLNQIRHEAARAVAQPVERLPFNRPLTGRRRFSWVEWPLAPFTKIRAAAGGVTLNDVVLAVIGDAVGRVLAEDGHDGPRAFRAMVPVNLRGAGEREDLGNRVTILPVEVALHEPPLERVRQVAARTRALKDVRAADTLDTLASAAGLLPAPLVSLAIGLAANPTLQSLTAPLRSASWLTANAVCTNVAGPPVPLYVQGRRLLAHYPVVPLAFEFGVGFAIFSYDGRLFIGVIADAGAFDDLDPLVRHLDAAFHAVCAEASAVSPDDPAPPGRRPPTRRPPRQR
jgi:WS/DGAT/MGAT family acyltransferase